MTINELKNVLEEMIDVSEVYRANAKGSYNEGYEEGWYDALVEVISKL